MKPPRCPDCNAEPKFRVDGLLLVLVVEHEPSCPFLDRLTSDHTIQHHKKEN